MSSTPDSSQPLHWNPLVIASVGTICTLVFLLSYFLIFKQLILDIFYSRNQVRGRLLDGNDTDDPSLQSHSQSQNFVRTLPVTQFKEKNQGETNQSCTDCAVCLGDFQEGEQLRHLPTCSHSFHVSCIDAWFLDHSNCPLCRSEVNIPELKNECPIPLPNPLQTLRREEFFPVSTGHYQLLRSEILQNLATMHETATDANVLS